ncbi:hypothetical protein FKM82_004974 [Ascaphus truei]
MPESPCTQNPLFAFRSVTISANLCKVSGIRTSSKSPTAGTLLPPLSLSSALSDSRPCKTVSGSVMLHSSSM